MYRKPLILNLYFSIGLVFLLSGCGEWQSFCCSKCQVQTKDSIWRSVEYICETDTVPVPYRMVSWDTTYILMQDVILHRVLKDKGATGTIDINKGKVSLKCECDSSQIYKDFYRKNIIQNERKTQTIMIPCSLEHKTKFNYFCTYFFWLAALILLISVVIKCLK